MGDKGGKKDKQKMQKQKIKKQMDEVILNMGLEIIILCEALIKNLSSRELCIKSNMPMASGGTIYLGIKGSRYMSKIKRYRFFN